MTPIAELVSRLNRGTSDFRGLLDPIYRAEIDRVMSDASRALQEQATQIKGMHADSMVQLNMLQQTQAKLAQAEADARRYRWLRSIAGTKVMCNHYYGERLDEEIDAALAAAGEKR